MEETHTHTCTHTGMPVFIHSPLLFQPLPASSQPSQPSALSGSPLVLPMATEPPPGPGSGPALSCSPAPTVTPPFLGHLRYLSDLQLLTCLPFLLGSKIQEVWESPGTELLPGRQEVLGWLQWPVLPPFQKLILGPWNLSSSPFTWALQSPPSETRNMSAGDLCWLLVLPPGRRPTGHDEGQGKSGGWRGCGRGLALTKLCGFRDRQPGKKPPEAIFTWFLVWSRT